MNRSNVHFLDLPTEILFYILKKLDNVDVLYSLFGINHDRLDSITREEIFSTTLNFASNVDDAIILGRFCNYILPRIHSNVKCLIVEPASMERILLATPYLNLTELKIFNFQRDNSLNYFTDDSSLQHILKQQITKIELINKDGDIAIELLKDYTKRVYSHILTYLENLEHLNVVGTSNLAYPCLSLRYLPSNTFSSLTLTYLSINVKTFNDCLCLLDGRLKQLTTFIVEIHNISSKSSMVHNLDDLPDMKCFSLIYYGLIKEYDNKFVSLLRRMLYLEKLTLYLRVANEGTVMDPIYLINEFSTCLPRLNSFKFYLSVDNNRNDFVRYISNNGSKPNYLNIGYQLVSSIVTSTADPATYHILTLPFEFFKLWFIGHIFPNIVFNYVIDLNVCDFVPFQHEFFLRIAKAFPLLKTFSITNSIPQSRNANKSFENIQSYQMLEYLYFISLDILRTDITPQSHNVNKSSDNIQSFEIVEYPHLTSLDISGSDFTYIEQFLNETKTHLSCLAKLSVEYEHLRIITKDFTRNATRRNCANVKQLFTREQIVGSKDYYIYFPLL